MRYSTNQWFFINPFWCKFTSKNKGWTACGRDIELKNGKVCLVAHCFDFTEDGDNEIVTFLKEIN